MMTKKNYVAIAARIKEARDRAARTKTQSSIPAHHAVQMIDILANELAVDFQDDNPRFNRITFCNACNVPVKL